MSISSARRTLYPALEPYDAGHQRVSELHEIYYEQCGNPDGMPVVFLHGGPGAGGDVTARRFFDPLAYRIVLVDQRGCGRSRPHAELRENTTWHLIDDLEAIRRKLGIDRWMVFGGSWGASLALLYAETHPACVTALVLRGIFLLRPKEIDWFYQSGASEIYPDAWETYWNFIPEAERGDMLRAYYRRLIGDDHTLALEAAKIWSLWEARTSHLFPSGSTIERFGADRFALAFARLEAHYFVNNAFMREPEQILTDVSAIRGIPGIIVQGRYDIVCPMGSAWELHKAWPEADFRVVADAGHSAFEPGIVHELITATDRFRSLPHTPGSP